MDDKVEKFRAYLPPWWNDDRRIQSLFAEFRKKELNPTGWQNKMDTWINLLNLFLQSKNMAIVSTNDICTAFERNKRFPACIDEVLNYMYSQNLIKPVEEFTYYESCKTWLSWSYYSFVKYPISRAWSVLREMFLPAAPQKFVFLDVLKDKADMIFKKHEENKLSSHVDNIIFLKEFQKQCVDICEEETFICAIMELERKNKLKVFSVSGGIQIIKFRENDNEELNFTEVDFAILRLKKALDKNVQKINELEEQQDKCVVQARQHLKERLKDKAIVMMKKKKRLEKETEKKYLVQDNLEALLNQVKNCNSEKMVLNAFKIGAHALKNYFNTNLNDVDDIMEEVREGIDDSSEIQRTLSESVNFENNDLLDLENELNDILKEGEKLPPMSVETRAYYKPGTYGISDDFVPSFPEVPSTPIGNSIDGNPERKKIQKELAA